MNRTRFRPRSKPAWLRALWPAVPPPVLIYTESHDKFSAERTSGWLYPWVCRVHYFSPEKWDVVHFEMRKCGHFLGYGFCCLMFLWSAQRVFATRGGEDSWQFLRRCAWWALLATLMLATWDEVHQSFIPSRTASPYDVMIDCFGGLVALTVWFGLQVWFRRRPAGEIA